jgi:hypothetical protein
MRKLESKLLQGSSVALVLAMATSQLALAHDMSAMSDPPASAKTGAIGQMGGHMSM